jgi:hypothetical protein
MEIFSINDSINSISILEGIRHLTMGERIIVKKVISAVEFPYFDVGMINNTERCTLVICYFDTTVPENPDAEWSGQFIDNLAELYATVLQSFLSLIGLDPNNSQGFYKNHITPEKHSYILDACTSFYSLEEYKMEPEKPNLVIETYAVDHTVWRNLRIARLRLRLRV